MAKTRRWTVREFERKEAAPSRLQSGSTYEPHLIGKDHPEVLPVHADHEVQPPELVVSHFSLYDLGLLNFFLLLFFG